MTKTDNSRLGAKLELRRYFLKKYHGEGPVRVFDACAGDQVIWRTLRQEFDCRYWGVDVKPKAGRLSIDSVRILAQPGWEFDLIDVDTYGSPWKHWAQIIEKKPRPLTVFLTIGSTMFGGATDDVALRAIGLWSLRHVLPTSFRRKLSDFSVEYCLAMSYLSSWHILECREATHSTSARYLGVRLEPTE